MCDSSAQTDTSLTKKSRNSKSSKASTTVHLLERQGLVRGRYRQGQSVRPAMSLRILDEFGNINIARTHLVPIDAHDVPDGFLPTQDRGWLLLRNWRLGPQERAAILSATSGDASYSKVNREIEIKVERCRPGSARPA